LKTSSFAKEEPVVAVAGFGLSGAPALPTDTLGQEAWQRLLVAVNHQRIEGLLAAAVDAGALPVTCDQLDDVRQAARGRSKVDLCLEYELLVTLRTLEDAGLQCRVLKGPAWAHAVYPDPAWRGFGDVDLLVRSDDWSGVIDALQATGARRVVSEVRPGFDRRFGKDATLLTPSGWQVDLHRTLVVGPFGLWIDEDELFACVASLSIGGVTMTTFDKEASFLHACYNAALGDDPPRLIAVRDVCQLALSGQPDPSVVAEMAGRWRATAVVARSLALAADLLGREVWSLPVAAPFAARRGTNFERALVATYRGPGRGYTSQLATVAAIAGTTERLAYLWALARPERSYLVARGMTPLSYLRTAARRIWQGR
jgi:hypothetical protein